MGGEQGAKDIALERMKVSVNTNSGEFVSQAALRDRGVLRFLLFTTLEASSPSKLGINCILRAISNLKTKYI